MAKIYDLWIVKFNNSKSWVCLPGWQGPWVPADPQEYYSPFLPPAPAKGKTNGKISDHALKIKKKIDTKNIV